MKWIILLILIACGKHESPPSKDLFDNDGDNIPNYQENGLDKYVAQLPPVGEIKGIISFHAKSNSHEPTEIKFSNQIDLKKTILSFLTKRKDLIQHEDFFAEFLRLRLEPPTEELFLNKTLYSIRFHVLTPIKESMQLVLVQDKKSDVLGKWESKMEINLSGEDLQNIISGKAQLSLLPGHKTEVKSNTYRLYFSHGKDVKVLYISHQLKPEGLLQELGIHYYTSPDTLNLFIEKSLKQENQWWVRSLNNGDKVIAYTSLDEIKKSLMNNYNLKKLVISRGDTTSINSIDIPHSSSKIYLQFRVGRMTKEYNDYTQNVPARSGIGICTNTHRDIKREFNNPVNMQEFLDGVQFSSEGLDLDVGNFYEEQDAQGIYWETSGVTLSSNLTIALKPRHTEIVPIGLLRSTCGVLPKQIRVNTESFYRVEIHAYVEKLN